MTADEWQPMHTDDGGVSFGGQFQSMQSSIDFAAVLHTDTAYMAETVYAPAPVVQPVAVPQPTARIEEIPVQEPASVAVTNEESEPVAEPEPKHEHTLSAQQTIPSDSAVDSVPVEVAQPVETSPSGEQENEAAETAPDASSSDVASVVTPIPTPGLESAAPASPTKPDLQELSEEAVIGDGEELPVEPEAPAELPPVDVEDVGVITVDTEAVPPAETPTATDAEPAPEVKPASPKPAPATPNDPLPEPTAE